MRPDRAPGRDAAIATLSSLLSCNRFISLGGPGGWGHKSVAFFIAHTLVTHFGNAVWVVDLAGIEDSDHVAMAVASMLQREASSQPVLGDLLTHLKDKELLLVFDNCDHVFAGVTQLTEQLFTEAPFVHVLISSREALHLSHHLAGEK